MITSLANLSAQQLRRAAAIKAQIESLEKEFQQIFGAAPKADAAQFAPKKKRRMSAAARAKISAAAKARWAKVKAAKKK
jgi:hypothetical protein